MIATWHVLRLAQPTEVVPWRPAETTYWQAGPSAGARIAMTDPRYWSFLGTWPDEDAALTAEAALSAQSNQRAAEIDGLAVFTFSVWDALRSATAWAYRAGPHRTMLDRNATEVLMEASGFWRFAVLGSYGTVDDRDPLKRLRHVVGH